MPNWIKNRILVGKPELMEAIRAKYDNEGQLDLSKIKSMPKELSIECGSKSDDGVNLYVTKVDPECGFYGSEKDKISSSEVKKLIKELSKHLFASNAKSLTEEEVNELREAYKDKFPEVESLGEAKISNIRKFGALNWYEWSIKNWGTKWNASNTAWDSKNVTFETAWDPALPAIIELSKQNPNIRMAVLYSDEDIGSHVGYMLLTGGRIDYEGTFPDQSRDAYKLAFDLWGCGDEYRYDEKEGTYKRKEE